MIRQLALIFVICSIFMIPSVALEPSWGFHTGKNRPINDITISPDGEIIAATDGSLFIITSTQELVASGLTANTVDISADNTFLVVAATQVCQVDRKGQQIWCNDEFIGNVETVLIQNSSHVYVILAVGKISYLDRDGHVIWSKPVGAPINDVALSPSGSYIVVSSAAGRVDAYNEDGSGRFFRKEDTAVSLFTLAIGGNYIVGGEEYGNKGKVSLFTPYGKKQWEYTTEGIVEDVAISNNGTVIVAIDKDILRKRMGTLYYFKINRSSSQGALQWKYQYASPVSCFDMTEDGSHIVIGSEDHKVVVFTNVGTILDEYDMGEAVTSITLANNGTQLAVGTSGGSIFYFEQPFAQHTASPTTNINTATNITPRILPTSPLNQTENHSGQNSSTINFWLIIPLVGLVLGGILLLMLPILYPKKK